MSSITLRPLYHRGTEATAIDAPKTGAINLAIRKLKGVRWSQTHKVWYLPWAKEAVAVIVAALAPLGLVGKAPLMQYLNKRSGVKATELPPANALSHLSATGEDVRRRLPVQTAAPQLSQENRKALQRFIEELKGKGYSPSTLQTYRSEFLRLLQVLKQKPVHELTPDDLRRYMVYALQKEDISENTAHSRLNALKFISNRYWAGRSSFGKFPGQKNRCSFAKCSASGNWSGCFRR